jgi:hypothetical protein
VLLGCPAVRAAQQQSVPEISYNSTIDLFVAELLNWRVQKLTLYPKK